MNHQAKNWGFTIVELLAVLAVIAILGAIATVGYQEYIFRARATDIILKYDAIKTDVGVRLSKSKVVDDCSELASSFDATHLTVNYAALAYGFEATNGGYRPVLTVCAKADPANPMGVKVAKGAYETMAKINGVEGSPLITASLVSFGLPLTNDKVAVCNKNVPAPASTCSQPQASPAQASATYPGPSACPAGSDRLLTEGAGGSKEWACFGSCPSGQVRSGLNPTECCASADLVDLLGSGKPECLPPCQPGQTRDSGGQCV